ncbi:hypothetical protein GCM10018980_34390 [Streptomyces capoamus]|uniref:Uncharacterized protein n=1 Tax=Streptomyces capoamus TaxID=68183 RepID=A0A919EXA2_9ACTN|nr:hypothetical protein GCM10010501_05020 [Streptomyces libani subsp. rufus]GHG51613.1 hypothetical protein GCM10018980_34390 [Streptomyces capoamus]
MFRVITQANPTARARVPGPGRDRRGPGGAAYRDQEGEDDAQRGRVPTTAWPVSAPPADPPTR